MALPGALNSGHDMALGLLALGQMLNGVGAAPLYIVGPVWFGNMVSKKKLAGFLGIFYGSAAFGPAIGFVAEGLLVGATNWWLLFVVLAGMATPLILPLRDAPATCIEPASPNDEPVSPVNTPTVAASAQESFLVAMKDVVKNQTFVLSTCAGACQVLVVSGLTVYIPKFVSLNFDMSNGKAAMVVGACVVPGAVGGMALGAWCVQQLNGSVVGAMWVCVASTTLLLPTAFMWQVQSAVLFFPMLIGIMVLVFANHVPNTHILINVLQGSLQGTGMGVQVCVRETTPPLLTPFHTRRCYPRLTLSLSIVADSPSACCTYCTECGVSCLRINPRSQDTIATFAFGALP